MNPQALERICDKRQQRRFIVTAKDNSRVPEVHDVVDNSLRGELVVAGRLTRDDMYKWAPGAATVADNNPNSVLKVLFTQLVQPEESLLSETRVIHMDDGY